MPIPGLDHPFEQGEVLGLLEGAHGLRELGAEASLLVNAALERELLQHPAAAGVQVHAGELPALGALTLGHAHHARSRFGS
jgi:hypothetical protein